MASNLICHGGGMKRSVRKHLEEALSEESICHILVTCHSPSKDGKMHVEMTYQGDPSLVSYLLQNAQNLIDQENDLDEEIEDDSCEKVVRLVEN